MLAQSAQSTSQSSQYYCELQLRQSLYKARLSTTWHYKACTKRFLVYTSLHYKACTKNLPVLLCTRRLPILICTTKDCTKHVPVLLWTPKLAQNTFQYYFVLQSLHKPLFCTVLESLHKALLGITLYYKACTKCFPVLLCTTKLAQSTFQ